MCWKEIKQIVLGILKKTKRSDKDFHKILNKFSTSPFSNVIALNIFKNAASEEDKELRRLYLQFKIFKWTKWLVFATWSLAIATLVLAFIK